MKIRTYIRVAKQKGIGRVKVDAGTKDNPQPLYKPGYRGEKEYLPTVRFAVDFDIPEELFSQASKVIGEINIALEKAIIAATLPGVSETP